ncbi:SRPBCC family protein [Allomuricauda sp. SCSIO 65647]|uniref:SRPBCC family protein n=1 Tax=Allomuricauda sp. SCSIO 65647 TaxID=2908843 RepID=UPI001F276FFE|nr:SRPBCC family protein [Muricauda sp. SCSIO 65647]UJH68100.1 SRPBCC family protein [Muricauda sp. SCSIO 65647]
MHIEVPKKTIEKSNQEVFEFLVEVKNFESLMPENIDKFEVIDHDTFKFALKGMPEIVLRMKEKQPHDKVVLGAASDKLPFTLTADILSVDDQNSEIVLSFSGEFNAMMAMMIKGPITNLMNTLSENLQKI